MSYGNPFFIRTYTIKISVCVCRVEVYLLQQLHAHHRIMYIRMCGVIRSNDCAGPTGEKKIERSVSCVPVYSTYTAARFSEYCIIAYILCSLYYVYNIFIVYYILQCTYRLYYKVFAIQCCV